MKKILLAMLVFGILAPAIPAQPQQAPAAGELTRLLNRFLQGASTNDIKMHDRFWAEELIYTSSSGERYGKERIMKSLRNGRRPSDGDTTRTTYTAEDVQIQQYGTTAIVAFRLVASRKTPDGTEPDVYLNSGTFIKRNGHWKAVNWQATRVP